MRKHARFEQQFPAKFSQFFRKFLLEGLDGGSVYKLKYICALEGVAERCGSHSERVAFAMFLLMWYH